MKMAKASQRDIDAGGELMRILSSIEQGDEVDTEDIDSLRSLHKKLEDLLNTAPGFHARIIVGMCHVIMYHKNQIINPDADVLELHPRLIDGLKDHQRLEHLLKHLPGDVLRQVLGEISDTGDLAAFRNAIDALIQRENKDDHG